MTNKNNNIKNCIILFLIGIIFFMGYLLLNKPKIEKHPLSNFPPKGERITTKNQENFSKKEDTQEKKDNVFVKKIEEKNIENSQNKINNFCQQFIDKKNYYKVWSKTKPKINKTHIFCGEINSRGKASGFHSRRNGQNPATAKIIKKQNENKLGIYTAKVEILDIKKNIYKSKFSTIFPDNLSIEEIENAILNAWNNKKFYKKSKFRGPSGLGFEIEGYSLKGKINTAYPIYKK